MKITLTGSLGRIGAPLAKALLNKGDTVTIVSHNPERKKEIGHPQSFNKLLKIKTSL